MIKIRKLTEKGEQALDNLIEKIEKNFRLIAVSFREERRKNDGRKNYQRIRTIMFILYGKT